MQSEALCLEAVKILKSRGKTHGSKFEQHSYAANLIGAYLHKDILPSDVAIICLLIKISRSKFGETNLDDYVDMIGYASIAGECETE